MDPQHYNKNYVVRRSNFRQQQKNRFPPSDSSSSSGDRWLSTWVKRGWLLSPPTRIDEQYLGKIKTVPYHFWVKINRGAAEKAELYMVHRVPVPCIITGLVTACRYLNNLDNLDGADPVVV
jgi:hypothetical protein